MSMLFETVDISGMGGGYERCCQQMLQAGVAFLKERPDFNFDYKSYKNIYGIAWSESEDAKALDAVLLKAADNDMTGAMHQCVVRHLAYIHSHGYEKWLAAVPAERRYTYPHGLPEPSSDA